jgi:hypothetical protein
MKIIEGFTYEKYTWNKYPNEEYSYIAVPITLLIMEHGEHTRTHFIFWN